MFILKIVYNLSIRTFQALIILATLWNDRARKWLNGRKGLFDKMERELKPEAHYIWFHCASLGEFEQGRPLIEKLKKKYPEYQIVLTFFSPSGYEIRKNYELADHVFYFPLDLRSNAQKFIRLVNPELAVFIKYEFWYQFFRELERREIPLIMVSSIFRTDQPFFKWYGGLHRRMLKAVKHFFVQNESSIRLLKSIGLENATEIPDTRIDRVADIALHTKEIPEVSNWRNGQSVLMGGSTYAREEEMIVQLLKSGVWTGKVIITPHHVDAAHIRQILQSLEGKAIPFSRLKQEPELQSQVLVIDNIGMLSSLYQYADLAFIGGGWGSGIHNILEPATFSLPVIFGPNHSKFIEAQELMSVGGALEILDYDDLEQSVKKLLQNDHLSKAGQASGQYIQSHTGGTETVFAYLEKLLGE